MAVLHICIQGYFTYFIIGFAKNIEICFICIVTGILIIGRYIRTLLRPLYIIIMRPLVNVIGAAEHKIQVFLCLVFQVIGNAVKLII